MFDFVLDPKGLLQPEPETSGMSYQLGVGSCPVVASFGGDGPIQYGWSPGERDILLWQGWRICLPQFSIWRLGISRNLGMLFHLPTAFLRVAGCIFPASSHSRGYFHVSMWIFQYWPWQEEEDMCYVYTYIYLLIMCIQGYIPVYKQLATTGMPSINLSPCFDEQSSRHVTTAPFSLRFHK